MIVDEFALRDYIRCPMRDLHPFRADSAHLWRQAADPVIAHVLRQEANNEPLEMPVILNLLTDLHYKQARKPGPAKWTSVCDITKIAAGLSRLRMDYRILEPIQKYRLDFKGITLENSWAVVRRWNGNESAVLRIWGLEDEEQPFNPAKRYMPDLVNYARIYCFHQSRPGLKRYKVLNFHLARQMSWWDTIQPVLAAQAVTATLRMWAGGWRYPSPGKHCLSCVQRACSVRAPRRRKESPRKWLEMCLNPEDPTPPDLFSAVATLDEEANRPPAQQAPPDA